MGRFTDKWVIDRTLFNYVAGGDCACCGLSNSLFFPGGLRGLIASISDLETDAAENEFRHAEQSPWPPEMRDQIWADRVRLRYKMKKEMSRYQDFFSTSQEQQELDRWCREELGAEGLLKVLQISRQAVMDQIHDAYGIHSAFKEVLSAVVEQVVNFKKTKYPTDARGKDEVDFENILLFDRRGGFVLPIAKQDRRGNIIINETVYTTLFNRMLSMGGPKLLGRGPKTTMAHNDEDDDDDDDDKDGSNNNNTTTNEGPSFRSDRRIVRLLIARYWTDQLLQLYKNANEKVAEETSD